jgi:outer membrane lipoprotein
VLKKKLLLCLIFCVTACSTVPDSLYISEQTPLVTYEQAVSQADALLNKAARWGGVIAELENLKEGTLVEVVHYPLRGYGKPVISDKSIGRYRVYVDGFLDPVVFEEGRSITFKGVFTGLEEGTVGELNYSFPVIEAQGFHLWREVESVDVAWIEFWPRYHWSSFYWHGVPYRHTRFVHGRVVTDKGRSGFSSDEMKPVKPNTPSAPKPRSELERIK